MTRTFFDATCHAILESSLLNPGSYQGPLPRLTVTILGLFSRNGQGVQDLEETSDYS